MGYEIQGKDTRCVSCGMKIRSHEDGVMFSMTKDGHKLPFHTVCLNRLLTDAGIPLDNIQTEVVVDGI